MRRAYRLQNPIQHYAWGTRGADAFIPRLLGIPPAPDQPYAELWMGAHPQAPSRVLVNGEPVPLPDWLAQAPAARLGDAPALPFLFKVLSIAEPLSIQAHPDAELAPRLHARDPLHYPDPYAKPELVLALDRLEALVGFLPWEQWGALAAALPELVAFVPQPLPQTAEALRAWYTSLVRRAQAEPSALLALQEALAARLRTTAARWPTAALFLTLKERYPGPDVGLVTSLLLNPITLAAGEALFLAPGLPHAYLRGNALECMANSDNVVRAGLTSKFVDVDTWLAVLDFAARAPQTVGQEAWHGRSYLVPQAAFAVTQVRAPAGAWRGAHWHGPALFFVLDGTVQTEEGEVLRRGEAAFLPARPGALRWRYATDAEVYLVSSAAPAIEALSGLVAGTLDEEGVDVTP